MNLPKDLDNTPPLTFESDKSLRSFSSPRSVMQHCEFDKGDPMIPHFPMYSHSAYVLVNNDRAQRQLPKLSPSRFLDQLGEIHAQQLAPRARLVHSFVCLPELEDVHNSPNVGQNILQGISVQEIECILKHLSHVPTVQ